MQQGNAQPSITSPGDQACKECKRRKARCDKALPQCAPCVKYRRHCLYDRHSKSPLTRKYVTELEERLRVSETRAMEAETRAQLAEQQLGRLLNDSNITSASATGSPTASLHHVQPDAATPSAFRTFSISSSPADPSVQTAAFTQDSDTHPNSSTSTGTVSRFEADQTIMEAEAISRDFSWNEQTTEDEDKEGEKENKHAGFCDNEQVSDGMASLTVEDGESGYLGNTSGAAMLRLLLSDTQYRKGCQRNQKLRLSATCPSSPPEAWIPTPLWTKLRIRNIDLDAMIDSYFKVFHLSYPLVHEPTFRAQYTQVIARPHGSSWNALAYIIAAIGAYTNADVPPPVHKALFNASRSNMSFRSLETGNPTLVQCLSLTQYYLQKIGKPNSGYVYLGLSLHMAMAIGLHKELHGRNTLPLDMENRRRAWWCLFAFSSGAQVTFGRPVAWPQIGVDVALPLNIDDRCLTSMSRSLPSEADHITHHSSLTFQSKLHLATNQIYLRVVSEPAPSAGELLQLDDAHIGGWISSLPSWYAEDADVPEKFRLSHAIIWWRVRNFRIIMYRPFVIRTVLRACSTGESAESPGEETAYRRCLSEAKQTIFTVEKLWAQTARTRIGAWYLLYLLFQASLIPCVCLHHRPTAPDARDWAEQLQIALRVCDSMKDINPSARDCHDVIVRLCGPFIQSPGSNTAIPITSSPESPAREPLRTHINWAMWPSDAGEIDIAMQDRAWTDLFGELMDPGIGGSLMGTMDDFQ